MRFKKLAIVAILGMMVAALALAGCGGGSSSSSSSSSEAEESSSSSAATEATGDYTLLHEGELTVLLSPDYPPFENTAENGDIEGFEVDLFKAVAEEMDLTYTPVTMQFDAIQPAIQAGGQGDVGVSGFSVTPEREKEVVFTESFYVDNQAVAVMDDSDITEENAEEELNKEGVTIAVQTGTTGEDWARENFPEAKIQGFGNSTDCFAAMQSGNADAVCTNLAVVERMLADAYSDARIVIESATGEEYAAIVSQDNPGLAEAISAALDTLEENGTIDELMEKWF